MPGPHNRIPPKPSRWTVRSPPKVNDPAALASIMLAMPGHSRPRVRGPKAKRRNDPAMPEATQAVALPELRHTAAHVLAYAVQDLFPEAKPTIGPAIENGFYYDFERAQPFTPEDLGRLEGRMKEIVAADFPMTGDAVSREQALARFAGNPYKLEIARAIWLDRLKQPACPHRRAPARSRAAELVRRRANRAGGSAVRRARRHRRADG